jgi:superfamily I DNA/RNA helicase
MTWVIVPKAAVEALSNSARVRRALASIISTEQLAKREAVLCEGGGAILVEPINSTCIVGAWSEANVADIPIDGQSLLAVWMGTTAASIARLPDEEIAGALERLCSLARRLWEGLNLPDNWKPKKVGQFQSIFASSRVDIRIAYSVRNIKGVNHVCTGSVYVAYHPANVTVPGFDEAILTGLPPRLSRPNALVSSEHGVFDELSEDPDVVIERGRGEDRHLFSMSRSDWIGSDSPLTRQQRRIINDKKLPLRIHGPGGSGKTLVLILKALQLLNEAVEAQKACKILIILHNNEVRTNVRAAIEAIDDRGFLATTKSDLQYLDVETLHGWCMRELKIDADGIDYALHQDAVASKVKQNEILSEIINNAVSQRLPKTRVLLSGDLVAHLEGPRDKLVSNMRHEIAIRIKGRGMRDEQQLYVDSPLKSFVGRAESRHDRYFLFKVAEEYEAALREISRLDTDDVVLSMQSRLTDPLWNRRRSTAGHDYVFVDETHLFNENERRVLPYLTRGGGGAVPIVMTFDEAQSIGGYRAVELDKIGIPNSGTRTLSYVHRSSPDIYRLARDLVERSSLLFSEFSGGASVSRMSQKDLRKCVRPSVDFADGVEEVSQSALETARKLRSRNFPRVGIISFHQRLLEEISAALLDSMGDGTILRERGDSTAGNPFPGIFIMSAENCGGLEFDAIILVGVDQGRLPPPLHKISVEGHMSIREEACKELYTALTRARYHAAFIVDKRNGPSEYLKPWIEEGLVDVVGP